MLKGAQRGYAKGLALHLLNEDDNDFVEVHDVSGFVSEDVTGAFKEVQAVAKGTKCSQPFFSVSINPPANVSVPVEMFEEAADRIAEVNGLVGQPRVLVFHEKDGRRHAHVVFSRIDAQTMTAKNLPHFKNRLMSLSRDLFFEHQWKMPAGLRDRSLKSPTNVTLAEWQAAKRRGKNAIDQKKLIQQCWMVSDGRSGFEAALQDHGYILAKGDRRGHVVVCHDGEVLAVARAIGKRAKAVRERLGEADGLPSVDDAMAQHRNKLRRQFVRMAGEARNDLAVERAALENERKRLITAHRSERTMLDDGQARRWYAEAEGRANRLKIGISGLWQRLTGQRRKLLDQNVRETHSALCRDRKQRQQLIDAQLLERQAIEKKRTTLRQTAFGLIEEMRSERNKLIEKLTNPRPTSRRRRPKQNQTESFDLEL